MKMYRKISLLALAVSLSLLLSGLAQAVSHPFDFHSNSKMVHKIHGPLKNTYGYVNVATNTYGKGMIKVMFSNGGMIDSARFNARVIFLDAAGDIIKEEHLESWIDAVGVQQTVEARVTKALTIPDFDSIKVEFYLSDTADLVATLGASE